VHDIGCVATTKCPDADVLSSTGWKTIQLQDAMRGEGELKVVQLQDAVLGGGAIQLKAAALSESQLLHAQLSGSSHNILEQLMLASLA
jgi:hypothetical protein